MQYCIECFLEKPESEFDGPHFCKRCQERNGGTLCIEPEIPFKELWKKIEAKWGKKKQDIPAPTEGRPSKEERKAIIKEYKKANNG